MNKYSDKELTPVEYGISPVKISEFSFPPYSPCFPFHWHERLEILIVDSGELYVSCGGRDLCAKKGDIIVVNCEQTHSGYTDASPVEYRAFMFELSGLSNSRVENNEYFEPLMRGRMTFKYLLRDKFLTDIFDKMSSEKRRGDIAFPIYLKSYIYMLLGRLCRCHTDNRIVAVANDKKLYEILEYIEQHFDKGITVKEISNRFGYTEAYLCRKFKEATGLPPAKYIVTLRLEKAEKLLLSTESSCEEIATLCGFHDRNYFSRCFSAAYGMTPTERRKMGRKLKT